MSATHTAQRIEKLIKKGLSPNSIAKKIGRPEDIERVHEQAESMEMQWVSDRAQWLPAAQIQVIE